MFLGVIGLILIPAAIIYLVITLIKKTFSKKVFWLMFIGGLVLLIVGIIIIPSEETDEPKEAAEEQVEEKSDEIDVKIGLKEIVKDGKVIFEGTTNLPDEAELLVTLSNEDGYRAQAKMSVENGKFTTEQFSNQGDQLESGTYTVDVSMGIVSTQSEAVQKVIGEESEHLTGDLVEYGEFGKSVNYTKALDIDGAEEVDHSALMKEFKEEIRSYYEDINSAYESHSKSLDLATWGEFAREFRKDTDALKDGIESSSLNQSERLDIGPTVTNLQFLLTAYAADLQDRGDDDEIKRLRDEIYKVVGN